MFCTGCGTKAGENSNYCSNCGEVLNPDKKSSFQTVGFEEFKKRKEIERSARFQPKKRLKESTVGKSSKAKAKDTEVSINVGFMKLEKSGNLKRCRGKTLPVKVKCTAKAESILEKSVKKHANHDKKIHEGLEYVLLYPDQSKVMYLPGTTEEFVLEKYRDDIGKSYQRVTLFIAKKNDWLFAELPSNWDESDFDDEEVETVAKEQDDKRIDVDKDSPRNRDLQPIITSVESTMCIPASGEGGLNTQVTDQSSQSFVSSSNSLVECPTCSLSFPIAEIADHADLCCDVRVGDVEELGEVEESVANGGESFKVEESLTVPVVNETVSIKEVVHALINNMSDRKPCRLNIRRKVIWSDFKEARQKGIIGAADHVKIVFIGEPAIDDGGPRREFFSGMPTFVKIMNV